MTCKSHIYVVVVHKATRRAFTLNRGYTLIDHDIADYRGIEIEPGQHVVSEFSKWLPTGDRQRPDWVKGTPDAAFIAFWLSEPK